MGKPAVKRRAPRKGKGMVEVTPASAVLHADLTPPAVETNDPEGAPVKRLDPDELKRLGELLNKLFMSYRSDRRILELRWLRNQRQYLGIYDPDVEKLLSPSRSKAYPKLTRIKVISVLSRIMNLMFPGNETNWSIKASPSPDMSVEDVKAAIEKAVAKDKASGVGNGPEIDDDYIMSAVQALADERAEKLSTLIKDQLEELGGDQSYDWVQLCRQVLLSGIMYGPGVLRGPYATPMQSSSWAMNKATGQPQPVTTTIYKPLFEFLSIWDFYPDLSAKTFESMDGYFTRKVMSRSQVRKLADRADFFGEVIEDYLNKTHQGNYRPLEHETELRAMGVKVNVNEQKMETSKFEVITWHGPVAGNVLMLAGVDVADAKMSDEIDAEVWLIDGNVIKAAINPWKELGVDVRTLHSFLFDTDDTSPMGQGLPNVMRDSQMSVCAAVRMLLDNASVVCGPQIEINRDLLITDQDQGVIEAFKIWVREGLGPDSQYPAVRDVNINSHLKELQEIVKMFMEFADAETFVGPATGGDMSQAPSEPMRTAAGASMLRGDAALPFKDVVRAYDRFTQSVLLSLVQFNRKFNPKRAAAGDYNVIARGATSLIAKEVRGMQLDNLVQTLTDEEKMHVDHRKMATARFEVRDMGDLLVTQEEADRRQAVQDAQNQQLQQQQQEQAEATLRKVLSEAFKNVTQGQKNAAAADANAVTAALTVLEQGVADELKGASGGIQQAGAGAGAGGATGAQPEQP